MINERHTNSFVPMNRAHFLNGSLWILVFCIAQVALGQSGQDRKPNIIFILADDLGYGDLGCYGQKSLSTPHIDRMASEGVRFTQHYAGSTVCAPSRASVMSGKTGGHSSVRGNGPAGQFLRDEETTLAEVLKGKGYKTAVVGKWGMGSPVALTDPQRNGFDYFYGYIDNHHAHNLFPEFLYENGKKTLLPGNKLRLKDGKNPWASLPEGTGVAEKKGTYAIDKLEEKALQFVEANHSEPFFLYLAVNIPHANNEGGQNGMEVPDFGPFAQKGWPDQEKGFAAMIKRLDDLTGNVIAKLKELKADENTMIIWSSDNGPHQEGGHKVDFFDSNGSYRGFKRDLYEGGIRVPLVVRWPGAVKPLVTDHLAHFSDLLATLCEVVGEPLPGDSDGISYLPLLLGKPALQKKHEYLYWEFYELGGRQAIRWEGWKGIRLNVQGGPDRAVFELYDLVSDPGETTNVAGSHPDVAEKIRQMMKEAHQPFPLAPIFD